jgi:two-component system, cell cycle sensor histidine kinase and response regulator CckA
LEVKIISDHIEHGASKGTVLIVDDEETICSITKLMIENAGFQALTASDGMEAIKITSENNGRIDCILLDHSMPNMNGDETFKILKSMYPNLKVIMMSGYNLQEISENLSDKGPIGYIQKPYTLAILIRAITDAINSK